MRKSRFVSLIALFLLAGFGLSGADSASRKVLVIVRQGLGPSMIFSAIHELDMMRKTLADTGYQAIITTDEDRTYSGKELVVEPDVKASAIRIGDYCGLLIPCMTAEDTVPGYAVAIIQEAYELGLPIAAQNSGVLLLAKAGILEGKHYCIEEFFRDKVMGGIYEGFGCTKDGRIVTSGTSPYMAKSYRRPDITQDLMTSFIALMDGSSGR